MRLKIKVIDESDTLTERFKIEFKKGSRILGFHSDDYQDKILVYFDNDETEEKEERTFCFLEEGNNISNPDEYRYLGTRDSSSRYLFEILSR